MSVAVVTSIYGGYDQLVDPCPQTVDAQWIAVTDTEMESDVWQVVVEPRPGMSPRRAAKLAKCLPCIYTSAEVVVWLDGSVRLTHDRSLEELLIWSEGAPMAQFSHPVRECAYEEAEFCIPIPKYADQPMKSQMDFYRLQGFPERMGLWATGIIVRHYDPAVPMVQRFGERWLLEQDRWSHQDQLSEPYLFWRFGIRPVQFPANLWSNNVLALASHASDL
jgi:hypothetical protein